MDANQEFGRAERLADGLVVGVALSLGGAACWMTVMGSRDSNVFQVMPLGLLIGVVLGVPIGLWRGRRFIGGHWLLPSLRKGLVGFSLLVLLVSLLVIPLIPERGITPDFVISRSAGLREKVQAQLDRVVESGNEVAERHAQQGLDLLDQVEDAAKAAAQAEANGLSDEQKPVAEAHLDALDKGLDDLEDWAKDFPDDDGSVAPPAPVPPTMPASESTEVTETEQDLGSYFPIPPELGILFPPAFFIAWGIGGKEKHRIVTRVETFTKQGDPPSREEIESLIKDFGLEGKGALDFLDGWQKAAYEATLTDEERAKFLRMLDELRNGITVESEKELEVVSQALSTVRAFVQQQGPTFDEDELAKLSSDLTSRYGEKPARFAKALVQAMLNEGVKDAKFLEAVRAAFE